MLIIGGLLLCGCLAVLVVLAGMNTLRQDENDNTWED